MTQEKLREIAAGLFIIASDLESESGGGNVNASSLRMFAEELYQSESESKCPEVNNRCE